MEFLAACKEAEAFGISKQDFLKVWEQETKMKQADQELRLQQMRLQTHGEKSQANFDAASVTNVVETHRQKFTADQHQVLSNLKEELQQQNQALIADISRLLEGFASLVGRVVKEELQTAMAGFNSSSNGMNGNHQSHQSGFPNQDSTRTCSKVHEKRPASQDLSSNEDFTPAEDLPRQAFGIAGNKTKQTITPQQQQLLRPSGSASIKSQSSSKHGGKVASTASMKSQQSYKQNINGTDKPETTNLSSSHVSIPREEIGNSAVHFFPENGPANMLIYDIAHVAHSGKISKSPVYYLQDCPCKVQLSLWFDTRKKMHMCANLWGLSIQPVKSPTVLTFSGSIKNQASQSYSSLFYCESDPLKLQHSSFLAVKLSLSLKTGTGVYVMNLTELENRNYLLEGRDAISINWTATAREIKN